MKTTEHITLVPDFAAAATYLHALDADATTFTFFTADDNKEHKDRALLQQWVGSLADSWARLVELNKRGAGCFVTVNETDGSGKRTTANMRRVRAIWHEDDGAGFLGELPSLPSMVVETSPGKRHSIWCVNGLSFDDHAALMRRLVQLGSDPNAADLCRVLRLPGTYHMKGAPTLVTVDAFWYSIAGTYPRDAIVKAFPVVAEVPKPEKIDAPAAPTGYPRAEVAKALAHIPPADDRDKWLRVGMMLHGGSAGGEAAFQQWALWSSQSDKYDGEDQERVWASFDASRGQRLGLGSLFQLASAHGYKKPAPTRDELADGFTKIDQNADLLHRPRDTSIAEIIARRKGALVAGLIEARQFGVFYGASTSGKTFLTLDMAWHIAFGREWHGIRTTRAPVLYVALEGVSGFDIRVEALRKELGDPGEFFARTKDRPLIAKSVREGGLDHIARAYAQLCASCGTSGGLIVIDTLAQAIAGDDENDTAEISSLASALTEFGAKVGATVALVHHENKDGKIRGNSALVGAADFIVHLRRQTDEHGKPKSPLRSAYKDKVKDGEDGELFQFTLRQVTVADNVETEPVTSCIVQVRGPGATHDQIELVAAHLNTVTDDRTWEKYSTSPHKGAAYFPRHLASLPPFQVAGCSEKVIVDALDALERERRAERIAHGRSKNGKSPERWKALRS